MPMFSVKIGGIFTNGTEYLIIFSDNATLAREAIQYFIGKRYLGSNEDLNDDEKMTLKKAVMNTFERVGRKNMVSVHIDVRTEVEIF